MTRLPRLLLLALASLSCAYYNGLYNANDLARRAEKAERQGRTFDAQGLWGQVAVKAETTLGRHPKSKWAGEARFLLGKARERTGDCVGAVGPLELVVQGSDAALADEAALLLSACRTRLGDIAGAGFAVERLLQSPDPVRRAEAGWRAGTAYRLAGRSAEAVTVLRSSPHPRARGELAAALADLGETAAAVALADSLLAERDTLVPWGAVVTSVGRHDPEAGSALLDRVLPILRPPADTAAAWLAADAARALARDTARAMARYELAYAAAPARGPGVDALIAGVRLRLDRATDPAFLDSVTALLGEVEPSAGEAMFRAQQLVAAATSARTRLDSLDPAAPQGDLRALLLGEALRDSLHAPHLAATVWRRTLALRAESPYAPKLLLALAALEPARVDSITALLEARYAASPYLAALRGGDAPGFRALEDSLARFAASARAQERAPVRGRRPTAAPTEGVVQ